MLTFNSVTLFTILKCRRSWRRGSNGGSFWLWCGM